MGYGQTGYWEQWEPEIGKDVDCIIRLTKDYAVFINKKHDVDWATTQEFDGQATDEEWGLINEVVSEGHVIDCSIATNLDLHHKRSARELILIAISLALEGCAPDARKKLEDARIYASTRNAELARKWIVVYTFQTLIILALIFTLYFAFYARHATEVGFSVLALLGGTVGSALSLIMRTTKLDLDIHAGKSMFYLEVFSRLFVGASSGFFVYIALKMGIFSIEFAVRNGETLGGCGLPLIIGLISGTTERWFKSLIEKSSQGES